jgi:ABC-type transporter Mla subunit MlaD
MTRGLGSSYIELKVTHYDVNKPAGPVLAKGSKLQGSTGVTSEFFPEETQKKVEELVKDLDTFINNANHIFGDPKNKADLDKTIAHLANVSGYASDRLRDAGGTLRDVNETLHVIKKAIIEDVRPAIADFQRFMSHADANSERLVVALVDASGELGETLSELRLILQKVNSGEGSAARFVYDAKFYETLLENAEQVELLLKDLKALVAEFRKKLPIKISVF